MIRYDEQERRKKEKTKHTRRTTTRICLRTVVPASAAIYNDNNCELAAAAAATAMCTQEHKPVELNIWYGKCRKIGFIDSVEAPAYAPHRKSVSGVCVNRRKPYGPIQPYTLTSPHFQVLVYSVELREYLRIEYNVSSSHHEWEFGESHIVVFVWRRFLPYLSCVRCCCCWPPSQTIPHNRLITHHHKVKVWNEIKICR